VAPTVFTEVKFAMRIAQEEIFGPVLSIMQVRSLEEAIEIANSVSYGLCSSIFTNDLRRAMTFIEKTEVGLTHVNMPTAYKEAQLEFGGIKDSGAGLPEAGQAGIEFFSQHKVVYINYGTEL
jgi:aldehyde dehydrogenase (NAD+)